mgnify:FL=1
MKLKKYEGNPIMSPRKEIPWENFCVLNPAVIYDDENDRFVMVYRAAGDDPAHVIRLGLATSKDGIHFTRYSDKPIFDVMPEEADGGCIEDPRLVKIDDCYFMTYASKPFYVGRYWLPPEERYNQGCPFVKTPVAGPTFINKKHTTTYLAYTKDFIHYKRCGRITDSRFDNRDCVIFPEKVNGKFVKIDRPYRDGPNPSIWITFSDDLMEWGEPTLLYKVGGESWDGERVGAGCPPLKTKEGWLLCYHGVSKIDHKYRVGFMLLDLLDPSKILAKTKNYVMEPDLPFESSEMYPGCVFPTGWVNRNGTLYIYYGCGDKHIALATSTIDEILEELHKKENQYKGERND